MHAASAARLLALVLVASAGCSPARRSDALVCPADDAACPALAGEWLALERERAAWPPLGGERDRAAAARQIGERMGQAAALAARYKTLVQGGSPVVSVAATYSLGAMLAEVGAAIRALPCPAGLEQALCEVVTRNYVEQAAPLEEEALLRFSAAAVLAEALPADSPWRVRVGEAQAAQLERLGAAVSPIAVRSAVEVELGDQPAELRDTLAAVEAAGVLRVALAAGESEVVPRVGSLRAAERSVAEAVAVELGVELRYVRVGAEDPFAALAGGQVELVAPSLAIRRDAPEGVWRSQPAAVPDDEEWRELLEGAEPAKRARPAVVWVARAGARELGQRVDAAIFANDLTLHRQEQYAGGLAEIKKRKVLRVAMLNNAASYFVYRGQEVGFQYEMAALVAARLGVRLEVVVPDKPSDMPALVRDGRVDLIPVALAEGADSSLAYSTPFMVADHVLVQPASEPPVTTAAELRGRAVHVRRSSVYVPRLAQLAAEVGLRLVFADEALETEDLIAQVGGGEIPMTAANTVLLGVERLFRDDVQGSLVLARDQPLVYGMRPEAVRLRARLDQLLARERKGPAYRAIVARYFDNPVRMQELRVEESSTSGRISPYDHLAQKHGAAHGIDWRLILAQMYNESRFDPNARSWVGARGLMQLMPRTAKELRVKNILEPEENVAGGVRYLAKMIAMTEPSLPMRQRVRFALAAYNAGMGHVRDARVLARRLKLDPDRWFGQTEKAMLLLEKPAYHRRARHGYCRGSEPVAYVSRIQSKYDAYQQLMPAVGGESLSGE